MKKYLSEFQLHASSCVAIMVVIIISYLFYFTAPDQLIISLGKEDGLFEYLTAIFYAIGAILVFLAFLKNKNIFLLLLALVLFFGAGEEISWGQRIFDFATPANIKKINAQGEFNIHNLESFNRKKMDGSLTTGWRRLLSMDLLFKIFTVIIGVIIPLLAYHARFASNIFKKIKAPIPPISIGIFFLLNWGILTLIPAPSDSMQEFQQQSIRTYSSAQQLENAYVHAWKTFQAAPEIFEFVASFIMLNLCIFFFKKRNDFPAGKDIKETI